MVDFEDMTLREILAHCGLTRHDIEVNGRPHIVLMHKGRAVSPGPGRHALRSVHDIRPWLLNSGWLTSRGAKGPDRVRPASGGLNKR